MRDEFVTKHIETQQHTMAQALTRNSGNLLICMGLTVLQDVATRSRKPIIYAVLRQTAHVRLV